MSREGRAERCGPLDGRAIAGREIAIAVAPPVSRFLFRGGAEASDRAGSAFGVALPEQANRAAESRDHAALWLGPDEWLFVAPAEESAVLREKIEREAGDAPHSLVDISHRQVALEVSGAKAEWVLNVGCPLDLDQAAFPVGMCTRTVLEKAEIVLWRRADDRFRLEVSRSAADYVWKILEEASREFVPRA